MSCDITILRWLGFALTILLSLGCSTRPQSDYSKLNLVKATGVVTLDGQPLANAVITFDGPDGQFSYGMTDSSGSYSLRLDSVKDGVTPGEKTVRISTTRKILGLNTSEGDESDPVSNNSKNSGEEEKVPARYNKQSELKVTVSPDRTRYDFELKTPGR